MDIKLNLTPEQIEAEVTKKLIESAIGNKIIKGIEEAINPGYFDNRDPIKDALRTEVSFILRELIRTEYQEHIKVKIRERLKDVEMINKIVDSWINDKFDVEI